jgi:hypothetical protein
VIIFRTSVEQEKHEGQTAYYEDAVKKTLKENNRRGGIEFRMDVKCANGNRLKINWLGGLQEFKVLPCTFKITQFQNKLKAVVYTYIASQLYSNKDKEKLLKAFREMDKDGDGVIGKE